MGKFYWGEVERKNICLHGRPCFVFLLFLLILLYSLLGLGRIGGRVDLSCKPMKTLLRSQHDPNVLLCNETPLTSLLSEVNSSERCPFTYLTVTF